ncbi:hypothetical protein [Paraburkholderia largidicola]|uniref:Lipoprotein n=1 Tax=Paraburkholderia largidicola TaxID=3014751 RepID=A0A7I8C575_9BURK|nr:hypothetical protein [Paraburkholderia sp. PGU16]BCF95368.1 hypothetical protein PPGU16_84350 [Paraburkholderia sp. PGU16]
MNINRIIQTVVAITVAVTMSPAFAQVPAVDLGAKTPPSYVVAVQALQQAPWSGPAGSVEAAKDEGITFTSLLTGVPKDSLTAELESFDGNTAAVAVSAPNGGRTCHYRMVKNAQQNAFGWEMLNSGVCSQS